MPQCSCVAIFFGVLRKASEVILIQKSAVIALVESATESVDDGSDRKVLKFFLSPKILHHYFPQALNFEKWFKRHGGKDATVMWSQALPIICCVSHVCCLEYRAVSIAGKTMPSKFYLETHTAQVEILKMRVMLVAGALKEFRVAESALLQFLHRP